MKSKIAIIIIIFSLVLKANSNEKNIVIVHPTVYILSVFDRMIDEEIFPDVKITGVYYEKERYDYSRSEEWIKNHDTSRYELIMITGNIDEDNMYSKNPATEQFVQLFNNSAGIIFTGGDDIQPWFYDEKTRITTGIEDNYRHIFELSFLYHLVGGEAISELKPLLELKSDYIVLGICLGMQSMCVASGGSLYQDIPSQIYNDEYFEDILTSRENSMHKNYWGKLYAEDSLSSGCLHKVQIKDSYFSKSTGISTDSLYTIYSSHHQSVKDPTKHYEVFCASEDGKVVEGIQHKKFKNVLGFQFHPEKPSLFFDDSQYKLHPKKNADSFRRIIMSRQERNLSAIVWVYFEALLNNN